MRYELDIERQREQLIKVLDYLKTKGIKQKEVAIKIGVDQITLSQIRNGTIKYIQREIVENLHDEFEINSDYILYGADCMFDKQGFKYANFERFVDEWDLVEYENGSYLHFTMDELFYDFLLEVYEYKEVVEKQTANKVTDSINYILNELKRKYNTKSKPREYVLIPADDIVRIVQENKQKRKALAEVVDILKI